MESFHRNVPRLYSGAPDAQTRQDTNPTLLVSWWTTAFSLAIILVRVFGRYIRTERLFSEDWVMTLSIIPLVARMGFIHVVLLFGTNNALPDGFTDEDIRKREIGSKLVLPARIFYALFIWTAKFTIAEFLGRLVSHIWRSTFRHVLIFIRYFLVITFIGVVIATLTECHPFDHHWQVIPDPGPKCRQGYAHLITMGACDVITDLLLVIFPVPIIHISAMPMKRKIALNVLFGLSVILIVITCYRVPSVIHRNGSQQYRSLIASLEILAAAAVSNTIVIGSFVRDRGVKKQKFKRDRFPSTSESVGRASTRRATLTHTHWGSDSDLAGGLGMRLDPDLQATAENYEKARPAPVASPPPVVPAARGSIDPNWQFSSIKPAPGGDQNPPTESLDGSGAHPHVYVKTSARKPENKSSAVIPGSSLESQSKVSLNDIGGLLQPSPKNTEEPNRESQDPGQQMDPEEPSRSRGLLRSFSGFLASGRSSRSISRSRHSENHSRTFHRPNLSREPSDFLPEIGDAGGLLNAREKDGNQLSQSS